VTDHIHRDDASLVDLPTHDEVGLEATEQTAAVTNAEAERAARAKREPEPVVTASVAPREFTAGPGDVEDASALPDGTSTSGDAADAIARWSAAGGPPAPRAPDCRAETTWLNDAPAGGGSLRAGDEWIAEHGAPRATLSEGPTGWLPD
jgi:hypothetical protein